MCKPSEYDHDLQRECALLFFSNSIPQGCTLASLSMLMTPGREVLYLIFLTMCVFRKNWHHESHALLPDVNENVQYIYIL
jgi:hypothetical protein